MFKRAAISNEYMIFYYFMNLVDILRSKRQKSYLYDHVVFESPLRAMTAISRFLVIKINMHHSYIIQQGIKISTWDL